MSIESVRIVPKTLSVEWLFNFYQNLLPEGRENFLDDCVHAEDHEKVRDYFRERGVEL